MTVEPRTSVENRSSLRPLGVLLTLLVGAWIAALVLILVQVT